MFAEISRIRSLLVRSCASGMAVAALTAAALPAAAAGPEQPVAGLPPSALALVNEATIVESSGAAVGSSGRVIWTHNDAGNDPVVYALSPAGDALATVTIDDAAAEDWEDAAAATVAGSDYVYIADTGDASKARSAAGEDNRTEFEILRFAEPELAAITGELSPAVEKLSVVFPNQQAVNVESLSVTAQGGILLVEKVQKKGREARVWLIDAPRWSAQNEPSEIGSIPYSGVSGADMDRAGKRFVVRTAALAAVYPVVDGLPDLAAQPVELAIPAQQQGESVAFTADGTGLVVGSEGRYQALWFVPLAEGVSPGLRPPPSSAADAAASPVQANSILAGILILVLAMLGTVLLSTVTRSRRPAWVMRPGATN